MINFNLKGRNAVVIGAAGGIGFGCAKKLAESGANVWIGDFNADGAAARAKELEALGVKAGSSFVNVAEKAAIEALFADAEKAFGGVDIFVNTAGIWNDTPWEELTTEIIDRVMHINLYGTIFADTVAVQYMRKGGKGGNIVNIASVSARQAHPVFPVYFASKAGVVSITKSMALYGAEDNIKVNAVLPGFVRTDMWERILDGMEAAGVGEGKLTREELFAGEAMVQIPLKRPQTVEDIGNTVAYLCSEGAENITGQSWQVCGGAVMI